MIKNRFFKKHYSRLIAEAVIKSAFCGLLIGFSANFLAALAAWIFDFEKFWLAIGIGAGVALISGVIFYFAKFRPTTQSIARRVDRLGLEERVVTMLELEHDESYIAMLQRENAKEHLSDVANKKIRMRFSKLLIAMTLVAAVVASGMTTIAGLADAEVIPNFNEMINPEDPLANYIAVSYIVEEGGEIQGVADQLLLPGEDTTPVVAIPEDGWVFVEWDDGYEYPERFEKNVQSEMVFVAIFAEIADGDGEGDGDGQGQGGQDGGSEGDQADDIPGGADSNAQQGADGNQNSDGDAEGGEEGDTQGSGSGGEEQGKENSGAHGQGAGAGGKWQDSNQFIDGNQYYRDQLDMYYEMAMEIFEQTGEIPPELREFFEAYFDSI